MVDWYLRLECAKELRNEVHKIVSKENILIKEDVLQLAETDDFIPKLNGILSLHPNWFHYFITNEKIIIGYFYVYYAICM